MSGTVAEQLTMLGSKLLELERWLANPPSTIAPLVLYDDLLADPSARLEALLGSVVPDQVGPTAQPQPAERAATRVLAFAAAPPGPVRSRSMSPRVPSAGAVGRDRAQMPRGSAALLAGQQSAALPDDPVDGQPLGAPQSSGAAHRSVALPQPPPWAVPEVRAPALPERDEQQGASLPARESSEPALGGAAAQFAQSDAALPAPGVITVEPSPLARAVRDPKGLATSTSGASPTRLAPPATRLSRGSASLLSILRAHNTPAATTRPQAAGAARRTHGPDGPAGSALIADEVAEDLMPGVVRGSASGDCVPTWREPAPRQRTITTPTSSDPAFGVDATNRLTSRAELPAAAAEQLIERLADRLEQALLRTYGTSGG